MKKVHELYFTNVCTFISIESSFIAFHYFFCQFWRNKSKMADLRWPLEVLEKKNKKSKPIQTEGRVGGAEFAHTFII